MHGGAGGESNPSGAVPQINSERISGVSNSPESMGNSSMRPTSAIPATSTAFELTFKRALELASEVVGEDVWLEDLLDY